MSAFGSLVQWPATACAMAALSGIVRAQDNCIIPRSDLVFSLPADAIPALNFPDVVSAEEADAFLEPRDLVLGVFLNGEARAYPHAILRWHEIVNDLVGGRLVAVNFCPLTGSGMVYSAKVGEELVLFGVSGLLYDNNNVLFDRTTRSLWSQMRLGAICGVHAGESAALYPVVQSTWQAWKALHPETTVVSFDTGFNRSYRANPYVAYNRIDNTELFFPQSFIDPRRPMKELVLGLQEGPVSRAYPYTDLGGRAAVNGRPVLVVYDRAAAMALPFDRRLADLETVLTFDVVDEAFPFRLRDRETGTLWSLTGVALDGPLEGSALTRIPTYTAMWFAWAAFHRGTEIYAPSQTTN